jgi:ribonuclease BN (tRNA processing enzyme)
MVWQLLDVIVRVPRWNPPLVHRLDTVCPMKLTVLGGCGAWPAAGQACSGYVLEHGGYRLLIDPGFATLPRLLEVMEADDVDAVVISHGHPDHCADLNPLLRARALRRDHPPALPVHTLPGAVDAVLSLDRPEMLAGAYALNEFTAGDRFEVGPFVVQTRLLPHFVPNAGFRLTAEGQTIAYTGDTGPTEDLIDLARGADIFLAEATFPEEVPADSASYLSSARDAGRNAAAAGVGHLVLTHLWPGTDSGNAAQAAALSYREEVSVASEGAVIDLD